MFDAPLDSIGRSNTRGGDLVDLVGDQFDVFPGQGVSPTSCCRAGSRFASGGYARQTNPAQEDRLGKLAPDVLGQLIAQKVILGTDRSGLRLPLGIDARHRQQRRTTAPELPQSIPSRVGRNVSDHSDAPEGNGSWILGAPT